MKIFCNNNIAENLLKQYFQNIEFVDREDADYQLVLEQDYFAIYIKNNLVQKISLPTKINLIVNFLEQAFTENAIQIGSVCFYPEKKICTYADKEIQLTAKEVEIINFLLEQNCEVTKEVILNQVWGYSSQVATHTLETHIYRLRTKFLKHDFIISNERGYRLNHEDTRN